MVAEDITKPVAEDICDTIVEDTHESSAKMSSHHLKQQIRLHVILKM